MNKLLTAIALAAFALGAQAASHAGGAPMKADMPASAASGAKKMKEKAPKAAKKAASGASAAK